jgi:aspartate-semialdehyde dehydrogenase
MGYKVAVVGATGNVGREILSVLDERAFPADEVVALASRRSMGTEVSFGDRTLKCKDLAQYDFSGTDLCLMSAGGEVSKEWSPKIAAQGAVVIDNSSAWRYDSDVPLVVPEVNADAVRGMKKGIIANPNCSTAQLVVALKPLHDRATIRRVVVATYQSVSGAGKDGMDELDRQTKALYSLQEVEEKKFPKRIAFNLIPQIDVFMEDGSTKEEWKMMVETKKILDPKIKLTATCVRVPVFIGHSEAVNVGVRAAAVRRTRPAASCARRRGWWSWTSASPAAPSRPTRRRARTPPTCPASARTSRWRTGCRSGACRTTCGKGRR